MDQTTNLAEKTEFWQQPQFGMFGWNWKQISELIVKQAKETNYRDDLFKHPALYLVAQDLNPVAFERGTAMRNYMEEIVNQEGNEGVKILSVNDSAKISRSLMDTKGIEVKFSRSKVFADYLSGREFVIGDRVFAEYDRDQDITRIAYVAESWDAASNRIESSTNATYKAIFERVWSGKRLGEKYIDDNTFGWKPPKAMSVRQWAKLL